ncbi:MAG: PTS sugar transporter subunit IIA [Candidatus Eisenbacteria bacterium]
MKLSELLNERAIGVSLQAATKDEVIKELVAILEKAHGLKSGAEILKKVVEREAMASTGIGHGVAIPHGKAASMRNLAAATGISSRNIDFKSADGEPVTLFVLLVSPEDCTGPHVRALANISKLLKEDSVRHQLKRSKSPHEFLEALKQAEATYL